jgi:hypothetical protein
MTIVGFLLSYLLLGALIAYWGTRPRRWQRFGATVVATSLPLLLWFLFLVKDALPFDRPIFDLVSESGRFGFYNGLMLVFFATPMWFFVALIGSYLGRRRQREKQAFLTFD